MANLMTPMTDALYDYMQHIGLREHPSLARLREKTRAMTNGHMQITPEQGQFLAWLVSLMGAKRTLDIGVFTGYSTAVVAHALPADGQVIACDKNSEWTSVGQPYWDELGVADKIELRLGPAVDTLQALIDQGEAGQFDFAFIDADKVNNQYYFEQCLTLVRVGGVIAVDNVFHGGNVVDPSVDGEGTKAVRAFNAKIHDDVRVDLSLVPLGDGVHLCRRLR